jgi:short-chain fatty acids transporter
MTLVQPHEHRYLHRAYLLIPLICMLMAPRKESEIERISEVNPDLLKKEEVVTIARDKMVIADRLENSRSFPASSARLALIYVIWFFATQGFKLDLNIVNFTFLFLGIIFQRTPINYIRAASEGRPGLRRDHRPVSVVRGHHGHDALLRPGRHHRRMVRGHFQRDHLSPVHVPERRPGQHLRAFRRRAVGGPGPDHDRGGQDDGLRINKTIMAVAYGDQWTNMLQPFWALALLGITKLKAREIVGYTMVVMVVSAVVFILGLLLLPV